MIKAPRNQTLQCSNKEIVELKRELITLDKPTKKSTILNKVINQDVLTAIAYLPKNFVDLLVLDPPYNLSKNYNGNIFREQEKQQYANWYDAMLQALLPTLTRRASLYICADWKTSMIIAPLLAKYFYIRNRVTWEREKGRGAKTNWKNNMEDIWFCTVGHEYTFNLDAVKIKRKVIAPYRQNGAPKDWKQEKDGKNYRITHPSNLWTDISIPFWSMPENTDHPTQKPEKLIAKIILASSDSKDIIFDPFAGSGTTAVVAKKLGRNFVATEINDVYCCWCLKRLQQANHNVAIQGYEDGVFWERNSYRQKKANSSNTPKKLL